MIVSAKPRPPGHRGYSTTLPGQEKSTGHARALVRTALTAWHLEDLTEAGTLLVTELVANAIQHTNSRHIHVAVVRRGAKSVRIAVSDNARTAPTMAEPQDDLPTGGRGLLIVSALAERWGTDLYRWGKQVWADLPCEPAA